MNIPASISPEVATWIRVQMTIASARAVEPLQAEVRRLEDFSNGLLVVLANVVPGVLAQNPELAGMLAPHWRSASERFEQMEREGLAVDDQGDTPDLLEARKLLYCLGKVRGVWPVQEPADVVNLSRGKSNGGTSSRRRA